MSNPTITHNASWDETCQWPRRLLHVSSMTSHHWQPGNSYGGYSNPEYNALSYTWGRWKLKSGTRPEVTALHIQGIEDIWSIPRIDPDHFSVADFNEVIHATANADLDSPVDFIWLDIACIDQRDSSPEMASEVGRQARIFKGANAVFIWLTKYKFDDLYDWATSLEEFAAAQDGMEEMVRLIDFLRRDPWFTSLWTLQEAFLRQDATFLSRDSRIITGKDDPISVKPFRLKDLTNIVGMLHAIISDSTAANYPGILDVLEESGFQELYRGFPMVLLTAAKYRQTSPERASDRVYGIMQVFDLQLGSSAPGVCRSQKFELSELQDQLGAGLLEKYPIMSQLHTHSKPAPFGKAWRVGENSTIPGLARLLYHEMTMNGELESFSTLSITTIDDAVWGFVEGTSTSVKGLQQTLSEKSPSINSIKNATKELYIALDTTDPTQVPELEGVPQYYWSLNQIDLASHLVYSCPTMRVLLLAVFHERKFTEKDQKPKRAFGLLLKPEREEHSQSPLWRRVGICLWTLTDCDYEAFKYMKTKKYACNGVYGEEWTYIEGPFG
ncbi:hypothetical protein BP6252_13934 [Coleophoma cylindrospora]|uniref:Heterokaryon incompatibility domain-containing protein n=1 Tax=Coleophoma cylindrospora TaxID=1849047 RepID=A0A3D8Q585_9HELO|nr:hypothetical protein BP6252_13934 [Coleophoma cylindrospora]